MSPNRKIFRYQGRLAHFQVSASDQPAAPRQDWEERWSKIDLRQQYQWTEKGALGLYKKAFLKYLPGDGLIVETGCGTGRYVRALAALGYQVVGIDWAAQTLIQYPGRCAPFSPGSRLSLGCDLPGCDRTFRRPVGLPFGQPADFATGRRLISGRALHELAAYQPRSKRSLCRGSHRRWFLPIYHERRRNPGFFDWHGI